MEKMIQFDGHAYFFKGVGSIQPPTTSYINPNFTTHQPVVAKRGWEPWIPEEAVVSMFHNHERRRLAPLAF